MDIAQQMKENQVNEKQLNDPQVNDGGQIGTATTDERGWDIVEFLTSFGGIVTIILAVIIVWFLLRLFDRFGSKEEPYDVMNEFYAKPIEDRDLGEEIKETATDMKEETEENLAHAKEEVEETVENLTERDY